MIQLFYYKITTMKKCILSFLLLGAIVMQAQTYQFEAFNETYEDLVGSTSLNDGEVWDDPAFTISLGFEFTIGDVTFDTLFIIEDGFGASMSTMSELDATPVPLLLPVGQDIIDLGFNANNSLSEISFLTSGNAGSRILKIEYNNVGFIEDLQTFDFMNFQIWLYETSNVLEYRYGTSEVQNTVNSFEGFSGPLVAFFPSANLEDGILLSEGYLLEGDPANPDLVTLVAGGTEANNSVDGVIPEGTVYRFTSDVLGVSDFNEAQLVLYPNPATDYLNIENFDSASAYQFFNNLGQKINIQIDDNGVVDLENLSTGFYTIQLVTPQGRLVEKFMKH
jgi:hypothetical protein